MESIYRDRNQVLIVNLPNQGAIFGLEASDVVEIPAVVGSKPPRPLTIGRLEPEILGLISQVKAYERLTVEAAVEKSKTKALLALASNPLVNGVEQAAALVEAINSHYQLDLKD
jgi:6-phospho-beta-glucosidase